MSTTNPQLTEVASSFERGSSVAERLGPRLRPETPAERVVRMFSNSLVTIIVVAIGLAWSIPTIGLLITSFRPVSFIQTSGWWTAIFPPWHFTLENYQQVITANGLGQAFINSLIISIPATILTVLVAAFAAYAFAWMKFPGRDWIFLTIVGLQVVPLQLALIPALSIFVNIGISGSFVAIWLFHTAYGIPFAIYLLRSFFGALPSDLFESAHIDGAGHVTIFFRLLMPLSVPSLAALVIFQFMWVWNDLLVALILLGGAPDKAPLALDCACPVVPDHFSALPANQNRGVELHEL